MRFLGSPLLFAFLIAVLLTPAVSAAAPQLGGIVGGKLFGKHDAKKDTKDDSKASTVQVKDGEAAVVQSPLSEADTVARVKAFLNARDLDFNVNPDTGRITTEWYGEQRCGSAITIGKTPQRCAYRAMIRVTTADSQVTARVQVVERRRDAAINMSNGPWNEDSTSKGKPTSQFAIELQRFLVPEK